MVHSLAQDLKSKRWFLQTTPNTFQHTGALMLVTWFAARDCAAMEMEPQHWLKLHMAGSPKCKSQPFTPFSFFQITNYKCKKKKKMRTYSISLCKYEDLNHLWKRSVSGISFSYFWTAYCLKQCSGVGFIPLKQPTTRGESRHQDDFPSLLGSCQVIHLEIQVSKWGFYINIK